MIFVFILLVIIASVATIYVATSLAELPINLPFKPASIEPMEISRESQSIMDQWYNRQIYEPDKVVDISNITDESRLNLEPITRDKFKEQFRFIDIDSLDLYIEENGGLKDSNNFAGLIVDKADKLNTATGIKAVNGTDDVITVDTVNGITIIGKTIGTADNSVKAKVIIVNDASKVLTECVKDLNEYLTIDKLYDEAEAILAINASEYSYTKGNSQAVISGAYKYNGRDISKASSDENIVNITESGNLSIGNSTEGAYNSVKCDTLLIKNGENIYNNTEDTERNAITAIGNTEKGEIIFVVASGGGYGSGIGATNTEVLQVFNEYGAVNAAVVSGGTKTIVYWNNRVITDNAEPFGVELPNAFIVKAYVKEDSDTDSESASNETVAEEQTENTENNK